LNTQKSLTYNYNSQGRLTDLPDLGTYGYNDADHFHAVTGEILPGFRLAERHVFCRSALYLAIPRSTGMT